LAAPDPEDRVKCAELREEALKRLAHRRDGGAPVAALNDRGGAAGRDLAALNIDGVRGSANAYVDDNRDRPGLRDRGPQIGKLVPFVSAVPTTRMRFATSAFP
jgi:hypothetical protein